MMPLINFIYQKTHQENTIYMDMEHSNIFSIFWPE